MTRFIDDYADNVMFESDFPHPTSLSPGPVSHTDSPDKVIEANLSEPQRRGSHKDPPQQRRTHLQPRTRHRRTTLMTTPGTTVIRGLLCCDESA